MKTHLDLFTGIGGFALAASWSGLETVAFCEIEPFACRVLKKNFPKITIHNDVRKTAEFKRYTDTIDLLTGGYPCQPFSVAGKQRGEEDDRHLWPAMLQVIKTVRPTWIIAENVAGHIKLGLDQVLTDLEGAGYTSRPIVVPACAVNAPHRRDRVWIIANSRSKRREGGESKQVQRLAVLSGGENGRRTSSREILPDISTPRLCGTGDGIPSRVDRTRGLGNSVVPQVAHEIISAIFNNQSSCR